MRRDLERLDDILESLDWIARAIDGLTEQKFLSDETVCYAVAHRLTVIGEAVSRLSVDLRSRYSAVPWPDIVGLRNILVHEYFGVYWPLVWQTVVDHAPELRRQISTIKAAEFGA